MTANTDRQPLFTFAVITDTHIRPAERDESSPFPVNNLANDRARFAVAAIHDEGPAFVLHLGDMVHPLPHLPSFIPAANEAHDIFAPLREIMHFIPGNHDIGDKPNPDAPAGPADDTTIAQYEKQFGPSRFVHEFQNCVFIGINSSLVNSNTEHETEQRKWLEARLDEHKNRRLFLCTHYPPFIYSADEQSHYDNYAEPGRSWLVGLIESYKVEAVLSGHVHQFFFNRRGDASLYCFPPTSFIRQDYAELYQIEPPNEFGRNDEGKFSYAMIDVYPEGHRVRIIPTDGAGLDNKTSLPSNRTRWSPAPATALTVPLRHAWAGAVDLPFNGPMEEFCRKRTRNDYTLMRLQQMGISRVRVPLGDLLDAESRARIQDYRETGIRFCFFEIGVPSPSACETIAQNQQLVEQLEIINGSDDLVDLDVTGSLGTIPANIPLLLGKSHSSKHEPQQGTKFAHSVSSGFKWEARDTVLAALRSLPAADRVAGIIFQLNLTDPMAERLADIDAFAVANTIKIEVNVRLAQANPAVANFDDEAIKARVLEAKDSAPTLKATAIQLDTFVDVDRGYNPRHGLLDRHYNFRPAGRALASTKGPMDTLLQPVDGQNRTSSTRAIC